MTALTLAGSVVLACSHPRPEPVAPKGHSAPPPIAAPAGGEIAAGSAAAASPAAPAAPSPSAPASVEREPGAIEALRRMAEFLRSQPAFVVRSESTTDEVLESGQKIQFEGGAELKVRRPNRLRADIKSDRKQRQLFYDGTSFTLYGKRVGYYATVPAPPTIIEMIEQAEARYGIDFPLVDLFRWGTGDGDEAVITGAVDIGPSRIQGVDTEHYAFRTAEVDFQLWIQKDAQPLPRKLLITTLAEPSQPQHAVVLTWTLNPKLGDSEFKFVPPAGAQRIAFEERQR